MPGAEPNWAAIRRNIASFDSTEINQRRMTWSFLTWCFFLSESVRHADAHVNGSVEAEDPAERSSSSFGEEVDTASLPIDDFAPRDWNPNLSVDPPFSDLAKTSFNPVDFDGNSVGTVGTATAPAPQATHLLGPANMASGAAAGAANDDDKSLSQLETAVPQNGLELHVDLGLLPTIAVDVDVLNVSLGDVLEGVSGLLDNGPVAGIIQLDPSVIAGVGINLLDAKAADEPNASDTIALNQVPGALVDALFSDGKYTDYHVELQADDQRSLPMPECLATQIVAAAASTDADTHQDPGATHTMLPSAVEEFTLRGSVDLTL